MWFKMEKPIQGKDIDFIIILRENLHFCEQLQVLSTGEGNLIPFPPPPHLLPQK